MRFYFFFTSTTNNALWQISNWRKIELCNPGVENQGHALLFLGESIHSLRARVAGRSCWLWGVCRGGGLCGGGSPHWQNNLKPCQKEHLSEIFKTVAVCHGRKRTSDPVCSMVTSCFAWPLCGLGSLDGGETAEQLSVWGRPPFLCVTRSCGG